MQLRDIVLPLLAISVPVASVRGETYRVPIHFPTIQAAVDSVAAGDVVLISTGVYAPFQISHSDGITLKGADGVLIDAAGSDYGVVIENSSAVRLVKLQIRDALVNGIDIANGSASVEKCTVLNSGGHGIQAVTANGSQFLRNRIEDSQGDGIRIRADTVLLERNRILRSGGNGVRVVGSELTIRFNQISENRLNGVQVGEPGSMARDILVEENRVEGPQDGGILLLGQGQSTSILENSIRRTANTALQVAYAGTRVDGNRITDAGRGILVVAPDCELKKNRVKDSLVDGLVLLAGAERSLVKRNRIKRSGDEGIEVFSSDNRIVRNRAKQSTDFDLFDHQAPGANVYKKNRFGTTNL